MNWAELAAGLILAMIFLTWSGADRAVREAEPGVRPAGADRVDAGELGGSSE